MNTRFALLAAASLALALACGPLFPDGGIARVRVAHLSPDAPAVDLCLSRRGEDQWNGPLFKEMGMQDGLGYSQVSTYLRIKAGEYDARLVPPGAPDCTVTLGLPDVTDLPPVPPGADLTVAALGELSGSFGIRAFVDEPRAPDGKAKLRFIHASPGTPRVDFGTGAGGDFQAVFQAVEFGSAGAPGAGYLELEPLVSTTVSARATGTTADALVVGGISLPAGKTVTAYAIGKLGSQAAPLSALICMDADWTVNNLASCAVARVPASTGGLRVAHLSPDAPAVDLCLAERHTTAFAGPVLKNLGVAAGLRYGQVTEYLQVKAGAYSVRLVAPGATSCAASLGGLPDVELPALPPGAAATVAAIGELGAAGTANAFRLRAYLDQRAPAPGKAGLRFIHASPGTPAVDVGLERGLFFDPVFARVSFGEYATGLGYSDGYVETAGLSGQVVSARASGTSADALVVGGVTVPPGQVATAFAVGKLGSAAAPLQVLFCQDSQPATNHLAACAVAAAPPPPASARVAHLSPDAPAVDVCLARRGSGKFRGPVRALAGASSGLRYTQVSGYLPLPPGAYDVRVVGAGAGDCSSPVVPDTMGLPSLAGGGYYTVAALGELRAGSHNPFGLRAFADERTPAAHKVKVRFVHAAPGAPSVDAGLGTGLAFTPVFQDVAFGWGGSADRDPFTAHTVFAVRPTGTTHSVLEITGVTVAAGATASIFAIRSPADPAALKGLICRDSDPEVDGLTPCAVLPL